MQSLMHIVQRTICTIAVCDVISFFNFEDSGWLVSLAFNVHKLNLS